MNNNTIYAKNINTYDICLLISETNIKFIYIKEWKMLRKYIGNLNVSRC